MIETGIRDCRRAIIALGIIACILFAGVLITGAMAVIGEEKSGEISADDAMLNALGVAQGTIQKDLSGIDRIVTNGATGIGQSGPDGNQALEILAGMSSSGPAAIDAVTTNLNGTIVAVRPDQVHVGDRNLHLQPDSYKTIIRTENPGDERPLCERGRVPGNRRRIPRILI